MKKEMIMKRSINPVPKLSGKPINAAKEKKHLTYDELVMTSSALSILRNSHPPAPFLPSGISRKGFIWVARNCRRWVIAGKVTCGNKGDYDSDKLSYYSGMCKGFPVFDNNRIRVYKTRGGAERAIKKIVSSGLLSKWQLSLVLI